MRRVIDDTMYEEVSEEIMEYMRLLRCRSSEVSEYSYGTYRALGSLIKEWLLSHCKLPFKFGKNMNTTGIGNNACYEIIYVGNDAEEQICGIIHLTDNMYGSIIAWCSDYDNGRKTFSVTIRGEEKKKAKVW